MYQTRGRFMRRTRSRAMIAQAVASVLILVLGATPAVATHRWSREQCRRTYDAWLRTQRTATDRQRARYKFKLDRKHGCRLLRRASPPLVPLPGLGADEHVWLRHHRPVPAVEHGFDAMPGAF